jgi:hypothetical protein
MDPNSLPMSSYLPMVLADKLSAKGIGDAHLISIARDRPGKVIACTKAALPATSADWQGIVTSFLPSMRSSSAVASMLGDFRKFPPRTKIGILAQPAAHITGPGKAIPLSGGAMNVLFMETIDIAALCVFTDSVFQGASVPAIDAAVGTPVKLALGTGLDQAFLIADSGNTIASFGNDAFAAKTDLDALFDIVQPKSTSRLRFIVNPKLAARLSTLSLIEGFGNFASQLSALGGELAGVEVILSDAAGEDELWLADPSRYGIDIGDLDIAISREASLQMDTEPTQSAVASVTASDVTSLFQTNSVALRVTLTIALQPLEGAPLACLTGCNWGEGSWPGAKSLAKRSPPWSGVMSATRPRRSRRGSRRSRRKLPS